MTWPRGWRCAPRSRRPCQLLRVAWRTVGSIVTRVNADVEARVDRLDGLRRIGIDEISYKRGHRYLIVVVDHDTGRLVWAGPGRNDAALHVFFDELGDDRAALLTHVSADMADWIARVVARRAPNAVQLRRSVPRRGVGHRRPRCRTPTGLERSRRAEPQPGKQNPMRRTAHVGQRPAHRPGSLRALEEPRPAHRPPAWPSSNGSPRPTPGSTAPTC